MGSRFGSPAERYIPFDLVSKVLASLTPPYFGASDFSPPRRPRPPHLCRRMTSTHTLRLDDGTPDEHHEFTVSRYRTCLARRLT